MITRRRVLVIARHFWPSTSDDSLRLQHWIRILLSEDTQVTLLTPRWHSSWPQRIVLDGLPVHRIDPPPSNSFRHGRYSRQLAQWVANSSESFDLIYCDDADLEPQALLNFLPNFPRSQLVVRFEAARSQTEPHSTLARPSEKAIDSCRKAALVLATDVAAHQQLLAYGITEANILRARQTQGCHYDRSPEARRRARQILCDINHDLFLRSQDRVVVCPGELTQAWGVDLLVRALTPLFDSHRALRLWILGDSKERPRIYDSLKHEGIHRVVSMPGVFTDLEQIFQAADLCVFPAARQGLGWLLPTCVASSIPALVSDCAEARLLLGQQAPQLTFASEQWLNLRQKLIAWLRDPAPLANSIAQVQQHRPPGTLWASHQMFQCLGARA